MANVVRYFEVVFETIPLQFLEIWGRVGFTIGFALMLFAFGGFTFRQGERWGLGRERQSWDAKAILSMVLTFTLIFVTGYLGSFIVLVPGAQTFEALKDLSVFLCIVLFGRPALVAVPIAYGLSDLIEGVPPGFLWDWLFGYFINPVFFWVAYQFIGKNPDFRKVRTWRWYLLFAAFFMSLEPVLWGYICSDKFTAAIAYRNITPALFFTTSITWLIAPLAMLGILPLVRKYGLFWAEIPGHVKERPVGRKEWIWISGKGQTRINPATTVNGFPIQMIIVTIFVVLTIILVGATAFFVLRSAKSDANKLAGRLHQEISKNIHLQLDQYLGHPQNKDVSKLWPGVGKLLQDLAIAKDGRVFILDRSGRQIAVSVTDGKVSDHKKPKKNEDPVIQNAILNLKLGLGNLDRLRGEFSFRFDVVTAKPLSRETWLAQATAYEDRRGGQSDWIVVTVMPETYYLGGVRAGNVQSAMVSAIALILVLLVASLLAAKVTHPIVRLSVATRALAQGNLTQRVAGSSIEELNTLSQSFNHMAEQLSESTERMRESEERFKAIADTSPIAIYLSVGIEQKAKYINPMFVQLFGYETAEVPSAEHWWPLAYPDDTYRRQVSEEWQRRAAQAIATNSEAEPMETTVTCKDGSRKNILWGFKTIGDENWAFGLDLTERKRAEEALRESESMFRALADQSITGIYMFQESRFLYVNQRFSEIFGYSVQEVLDSLKPTDVVAKEEVGDAAERIRARISGQAKNAHYTARGRRKDGAELWIEIYGTRIDLQGVPTITGTVMDITERKRAEVKAAEQLAELTRWHDALVGREERVIEIKQEVNELLARLGQPPRYAITSEKGPQE